MLRSSWSQGSGRAGLAPLVLEPNESLAIMNGTTVMRALACVAFARAARLARALTAMVTRAIFGNPQHFAPELFELKPHPDTILAGGWIRADLGPSDGSRPARLQDRYSIRRAPVPSTALCVRWSRPSSQIADSTTTSSTCWACIDPGRSPTTRRSSRWRRRDRRR